MPFKPFQHVVPADTRAATVGEVFHYQGTDDGHNRPCPVCGHILGAEPVVAVYLGCQSDDVNQDGNKHGVVIAVHAMCTDLPENNDKEQGGHAEAHSEHMPFSRGFAGCLRQ